MSSGEFKAIDWRRFGENLIGMIAEEWMLITPGVMGRWNTMTASWGGFGHLWAKDVALVVVRPSRHSFGFMEREEGFTLSFFGESGRKIHDICGTMSGRDTDKAAAAGITPRGFAERVGFEEARLVISCRKVFAQDLQASSFLDPSILPQNYPEGNLHRLYAGAVEGAWTRA